MAFTCTTTRFPRSGARTYEAMRTYFDGVKPWRSKFNPGGEERPIGSRSVKANDGRQFNKAMRLLNDGSIAFRLFNTDCVIYHPDGHVTIEGYPSMSTSAFIGALAPRGIHHGFRGRCDPWDPVIYLRSEAAWRQDDWRAYWREAQVIRCDDPVRLHYSTDEMRWFPVDPDGLRSFKVPVIDRRAAREVSRKYNLPTLEKVVHAAIALTGEPGYRSERTHGAAPMADIMDCLERADYMGAIRLMPRGGGSRSFGRSYASDNQLTPGFLQRLRNHIYEHEGVVDIVERTILKKAAYEKYIADSNRFGTVY